LNIFVIKIKIDIKIIILYVYNIIIMNQNSLLQKYLISHKHSDYKQKKGNNDIKHTHTSIAGGSYYIDSDDLEQFYKTYMDDVFKKKHIGHLTERQLEENGPIAIDFDFRYNTDVNKRLHTKDDIQDIIITYLEKLKEHIFHFNENEDIPIYVFEKSNINIVKKNDNTIIKDGIHIIIGLACDRRIQLLLRELVLKDMSDILEELPFTNSIEDVIDLSVTKGGSNWQLFGSSKPEHQAYDITHYYNYYLNSTGDFECIEEGDLDKFKNNIEYFKKISVRYEDNLKLDLKAKIKEDLKNDNNASRAEIRLTSSKENCNISNITSLEQLKKINDRIIDVDVNMTNNQKLKETYNYLMIINDPVYFHDYNGWIEIGWALKNTDERLFLSWMLFSAKSDKFNIRDMDDYYNIWTDMRLGEKCFTYKSIIYWAKCCYAGKKDNENEYLKLQKTSVDHFVTAAIKSTGKDFDIASILHCCYKDEYLLADHKNNIWFKYKKNKFNKVDGTPEILMIISKNIYDLFQQKMIDTINILHHHPSNESYTTKMNAPGATRKNVILTSEEKDYQTTEDKVCILNKLCGFCKDEGHKGAILKSCKQLFYDPDFIKESDQNTHLLCFDNGVYDFKEKLFRNGIPDDKITLSCNYDYIPIQEVKTSYKKEEKEIKEFFKQIYPLEELNTYMWNLLSSLLIGGNMNQAFYIFIGKGSNGKSMVTNLLEYVMGDYYGSLPATYITSERQKIGSTSSEIVALKGARVAIVNEPSKGATLNDGVMKEMTGGTDKMSARGLYESAITFIPQFKPIVCTNCLYDIKTNDGGTWRRLQKIDHLAYFADTPDTSKPYQFKKDKVVSSKFDKWKGVLMSLLVDIVKDTQGKFEPCDMVKASSEQYRNQQDLVSDFMNSRIIVEQGSKISRKKELQQEFKMFMEDVHGKKAPKAQELYDAMDNKYGDFNKGWHNIRLIYEDDDDN